MAWLREGSTSIFASATGQGWKVTIGYVAVALGMVAFAVRHFGPSHLTVRASLAGGAAMIVALAAFWSVRCPRCRRSLGRWAFSKGPAFSAMESFALAPNCPSCGYAPKGSNPRQNSAPRAQQP